MFRAGTENTVYVLTTHGNFVLTSNMFPPSNNVLLNFTHGKTATATTATASTATSTASTTATTSTVATADGDAAENVETSLTSSKNYCF